VVLLSVADADAAVAAVREGGGKVLTPPTSFVDRGRLALIEDSQGAKIALLETRDGDPPDQAATVGGFLWDELWTGDVEQATRFYQQLATYQAGDRQVSEGKNYRYLSAGGKPRVGILPNPIEGLAPVWVTYVRVADPAAITARVEALGGAVLAAAEPRDLGGSVALITDPSGAGIAIQSWNPPAQAAGIGSQ
jgi:predicted enzyme related to lactoylglutathione lyase